MKIFASLAEFTAQLAATTPSEETKRVRIAFLLTLNGRALRQVHRLLKALYAPEHVYYIHVDEVGHWPELGN